MVSFKGKLKKMMRADVGKSKLMSNVLTIEWNGNKTALISPRISQEAGGAEGGTRYARMSEDDAEEMEPLTGATHSTRHTRRN